MPRTSLNTESFGFEVVARAPSVEELRCDPAAFAKKHKTFEAYVKATCGSFQWAESDEKAAVLASLGIDSIESVGTKVYGKSAYDKLYFMQRVTSIFRGKDFAAFNVPGYTDDRVMIITSSTRGIAARIDADWSSRGPLFTFCCNQGAK